MFVLSHLPPYPIPTESGSITSKSRCLKMCLCCVFCHVQNYEHHAIVKFLESIGAAFGACQNAYTSCDETVYTLMVRTDDDTLLDTSIGVLSEFAARIRYGSRCRCLPTSVTRAHASPRSAPPLFATPLPFWLAACCQVCARGSSKRARCGYGRAAHGQRQSGSHDGVTLEGTYERVQVSGRSNVK